MDVPRMQLSGHLSLAEACASSTAIAHRIVNVPPIELIERNGVRLAEVFESLRALPILAGVPWYSLALVGEGELAKRRARGERFVTMHSIYRNLATNGLVGGSKDSAHIDFRALDFDPPADLTHDVLQHAIHDGVPAIDVIAEEGTERPESEGGSRWLHAQIARVGQVPRRIIVDWTVDRLGGKIIRKAPG